jgi:hypothetical protein
MSEVVLVKKEDAPSLNLVETVEEIKRAYLRSAQAQRAD